MSNKQLPSSPDEIQGGLRGAVTGVTRFGPRAMGVAFFAVCLLAGSVVYGLSARNPNTGANSVDAMMTAPPAVATDAPHFGQNEPIVSTPGPQVQTAQVAQVANVNETVPDIQPVNTSAPEPAQVQQAGSDPAAQAVADRMQQISQERAQAERARRQMIADANRSPIIAADLKSTPADSMLVHTVADAGNGANASGLPINNNSDDVLQRERSALKSRFSIIASSVIPATLITGIDSDQAGIVTAQVRENVYDSLSGQYLLIPQGSRLIGGYESSVSQGQARLQIAWKRLIFPDTTSIDLLKMSGADVQGGSGLAGTVDNHFGNIFRAALLSSVLAIGANASTSQQATILAVPSVGHVAAEAAGAQISDVGSQIVRRETTIPPTLHIPRGYPFVVVVDRDMLFPTPYHSGM